MRTSSFLRSGVIGAVGAVALAAAMYSMSVAAPPTSGSSVHSSLPSRAGAGDMLNVTHHHPEWIRVTAQDRTLLAAVSFPVRPDGAPVVVVVATDEQLTPWVRAVADQLTSEGYIAAVPDAIASDRAALAATLQQLAEHPAATGRTAVVTLASDLQIDSGSTSTRFALSASGWSDAVSQLHSVTGNITDKVVRLSGHGAEHASHPAGHAGHAAVAARSSGARSLGPGAPLGAAAPAPGADGPGGMRPGYPRGKLDHLPAGIFTAKTTLLRSPIRAEWVDIPTPGVYNGRMNTRITYPDGTAPAGIVVLMQHGPGMDDWMHAVGDQLSRQGFIALAADLHTGMGPGGGNYASFAGPEDVFAASANLNPAMTLAAYEAVRQYGLKLPRANGKSAALGFCMGGGNAWAMAANAPDLSAAVVYYGTAPRDEAVLARIAAPVIGFYGEDDARVTATVEMTAAAMNRLGKAFESHVYPHATHGFLEFQDLGGNAGATLDSWTRAIAFLGEQLR